MSTRRPPTRTDILRFFLRGWTQAGMLHYSALWREKLKSRWARKWSAHYLRTLKLQSLRCDARRRIAEQRFTAGEP